ncbi:MAG: hypothetical protein KIS91_07160 [Anaerolineae bacterium]|nr:hypothetical protein [Anaerolineae bacterium]
MKHKDWLIATPAPHEYLDAFPDLPRLVAQALYNRGYTDPPTARAILDGGTTDTHPDAMRRMQDAAAAGVPSAGRASRGLRRLRRRWRDCFGPARPYSARPRRRGAPVHPRPL